METFATAEVTPTSVFRFEQLMDAQVPEPTATVEGLLWEGQISVLAGAYGDGKTLWGTQLTLCLAVGRDFLGRKVRRPYKTAFIDCENLLGAIKGRVARQQNALELTEEEQHLLQQNWLYSRADSPDCPLFGMQLDKKPSAPLTQFVADNEPELLVIDNLGLAVATNLQEDDAVKQLYNSLKALRTTNPSLQNGGILLLHHITKPSRDQQAKASLLTSPRDFLGQTRGSGRVLDFCETRLGIAEERIDPGTFKVINGINRGEPPQPLIMQLNEETLSFELHENRRFRFEQMFRYCPLRKQIYEQLPATFTYSEAVSMTNPQTGRVYNNKTVSSTLSMVKAGGFLDHTGTTYTKTPA